MATLNSVWVGEQSLLIRCAEVWLEAGHAIDGVISRSNDIERWCSEKNIPYFSTLGKWEKSEANVSGQILWSVTNLDMLPQQILSRPWKACINFHDGPLPRYAGLNTPVWALSNGEEDYGISWHRMTEQMDQGDLFTAVPISISTDETALTLNAKCYEAAFEGFQQVLSKLNNDTLQGQPTGSSKLHFSRKQKPTACNHLNLQQPAADVLREIRALDFGPYPNPVGLPRIVGPNAVWTFPCDARELEQTANKDAGTLLDVSLEGWSVATHDQVLLLQNFKDMDGQPACPIQQAKALNLQKGDRIEAPKNAQELHKRLEWMGEDERRWVNRLKHFEPTQVPYSESTSTHNDSTNSLKLSSRSEMEWLAAFALWLIQTQGTAPVQFAVIDDGDEAQDAMGWRPAKFQPLASRTVESYLNHVQRELKRLNNRAPLARELFGRTPGLHNEAIKSMMIVVRLSNAANRSSIDHCASAHLCLNIRTDGSAELQVRSGLWPDNTQNRVIQQLESLADQLKKKDQLLGATNLLTDAERQQVLLDWNQTQIDYDPTVCLHELFEAQVEQTPDSTALTFRNQTLSYRELNGRANALAEILLREGIKPDHLVAICVDRSIEMVISMLAVLKAGGAYVPVDPTYPSDRIALMLEDSGAAIILSRATLQNKLPPNLEAKVIHVETVKDTTETNPTTKVNAENLAYVIYTSGSTGRPKGVEVEHRNVHNFFIGMDQKIPHDPPGVWLAITSLSFDISVLELLWTLTRGFEVVLFGDETKTLKQTRTSMPERPIDFNLFYFSSDASEAGVGEKYKLLIEGAKFADSHGFNAVWTPERHFHAFGGLYPNPSVAAAALATITENIQLRAGSCVLPLHHPARVAEEWSVVDNLSNGRVGISFASGWQPNDFCLKPENHERAKEIMVENIEVVRKLWRGEQVTFPGPKGDVEVSTLPRPVQRELPFWVTAAGNPETFRIAGEQGANMLTHLLGQSLEELADKIQVYRDAWKKAGHPGKGTVSLMLHTFVAPDEELVRSMVKEPLKNYLRSAAGLIKQYASSFPTFKNLSSAERADLDFQSMSEEDMDALLDHSVARYYETSGLFGTPEGCVEFVDGLKKIDVDEVACLIDFGVPSEVVQEHLPSLANLLERCRGETSSTDAVAAANPEDFSLASEINRRKVTHLQCTPSMATMFTLDPPAKEAIQSLDVWMIGGEAFPPDLAETWTQLETRPKILNMYGPTETTIWSSVEPVERYEGFVSIGKPIANTQLYILDSEGRPLPPEVSGELFIAGDGVVRGYKDREDLTAERFVPDPFADPSTRPQARMYKTGDLAQWLPDGRVKFFGRLDHQVKLRGYRIELGEIESTLRAYPAVAEAAVVLREDVPGDKRLVAYLTGIAEQDIPQLQQFVKERLPEFMVPAHLVPMQALPLTPNRKIDRNALPAPSEIAKSSTSTPAVAPGNETETLIAEVWKEALSIADVSVEDNFFDLGGHSLLTIQVLNRLRERSDATLQMTDLFRFPTIRSLAAFMVQGNTPSEQTQTAASRGAARRNRLRRRRN